ncbi:hypothetical protein PLICRDRAFT_419236 [Plicaturopsis crispa FD-325 SS-3]|nr:hypothetical protein PLICRDRAFT_419236 [Plicaturopsis crispa FD-325 SS-3]
MQYAGERTRGRMDLIVKHGATLQATYDPSTVTHIVTDATPTPTLRALGLKSLYDIPHHVPTVTWRWILSGLGKAQRMKVVEGQEEPEVKMAFEFEHAAFAQRIDAGPGWGGPGTEPAPLVWPVGPDARTRPKPKPNAKSAVKEPSKASGSDEFSHISEFTQEKPVPAAKNAQAAGSDARGNTRDEAPVQLATISHASDSSEPITPTSDPLAEFYAQATADHEATWLQSEASEPDINPSGNDDDDETDDEEEFVAKVPLQKRGFTCDNKEIQRSGCPNQDIVEKLTELMELHKAKSSAEDHWRVYSYSKGIRALKNYPQRIKSFNQARSIRGIGEKTAAKIMEILQTGSLRRIGYERTEDVEATRIFQGIYGVGRQIAYQWYASGCRTLDDVKARKGGITLTSQQEIGVRFYDDINERMPRSEAQALFDAIKPIALKIDPKLFIEIMGSFRRGKKDCGDIDIMITRPTDDGKTHAGVLPELLSRLRRAGILTEDLNLPEDPYDLENIYRGLCRLPPGSDGPRKRRRIDFLTVPWHSRGAALLYYTGDDIFNRAMRLKASTLGYSLNQRGLFGGVIRDPRNRTIKLSTGTLVASETEQEIFKILGVPWQEPHERVRG